MEDYKKKYEGSMKNIERLHESVDSKCKRIIEYYFPELKESKDEKMMNQLHSWMKEFGGAEEYTEKVYQWIKGLLEKRGEQKLSDLPKGEDYGIDSLYHAARILEKTLGEVDGYQSDDGILEHKCAIEAVNRLYKQNHSWSEEDECMMDNILNDEMCPLDIETINWLKSLKERMKGE